MHSASLYTLIHPGRLAYEYDTVPGGKQYMTWLASAVGDETPNLMLSAAVMSLTMTPCSWLVTVETVTSVAPVRSSVMD